LIVSDKILFDIALILPLNIVSFKCEYFKRLNNYIDRTKCMFDHIISIGKYNSINLLPIYLRFFEALQYK